ncbi:MULTISPECIES: pyridoxal-phosphate dependent enzyme [Pseudomonas]|uniref:cysteine synthase n=1 Tax=Pseudomonas quercus TaxID=2722792 RepID=A0ABX0YMX5_9PSED|nr:MULTISPECIES: pyridoxal-phosphate dependent enzyme [Pseudomonas]MBF7144696.1 pyridoxal-phosphate dependent enzyme [Pseudomonas sp. LY10J]NJP03233.1 pyridoxal-phosphate dependent enzyme [Pseudomonas quercus]
MSKLVRVGDRIFTKLEMNNPGGSHKYRAASLIIEAAVLSGEITPGLTTVIEKTGGNFGLGLVAACFKYNVLVELAVGLGCNKNKRELLECFGAKLIGLDMLAAGASPKDVVHHHLKNQAEMGKSYYYTDQFNNHAGVEAHRYHTAAELAHQLTEAGAGKKLLFVGCAGTGASFTGLTLGLKDHGFDVSTVLVDPSGCDSKTGIFLQHRLEGAAVGVCPPFLDWALVDSRSYVERDEMLAAQRWFYMQSGIFVGNTAAACLSAALRLAAVKHNKETSLVTIAYDTGLWYRDLQNSLAASAADRELSGCGQTL